MVTYDKVAFNIQWKTVNTDTKGRAPLPWCPLSELSEKNVTDTCVIDIKTKADREEEGWEQ